MTQQEIRINNLIAQWYKDEVNIPIYEYLGMSLEEYGNYVNGGRTLLKG